MLHNYERLFDRFVSEETSLICVLWFTAVVVVLLLLILCNNTSRLVVAISTNDGGGRKRKYDSHWQKIHHGAGVYLRNNQDQIIMAVV